MEPLKGRYLLLVISKYCREYNFELKTTTLCCRTWSNYSEYSDTTVCRLKEARVEHV